MQELENMMRYVKDFEPGDENYDTYVKILKEIGITLRQLKKNPDYIKEIMNLFSDVKAYYCIKNGDTCKLKNDGQFTELIVPGTTITPTSSEISTDRRPTIENMYISTDIPPIYYHGRQDVKYLNPSTFRRGGRKQTRKRKTRSTRKK